MPLIMPFDTETTSLPEWKLPSGDPSQPHIVSLAAMLIDADSHEVKQQMDVIIRPSGWSWDDTSEAFQTHGITMERAMDEGIDEKNAIEMLLDMWEQCSLKIAHNVSFDNRIVRIGLKRYFDDVLADKWKESPQKCTGQMAKPIMQLPPYGRYGYKMPSLAEAYQHFTGKPLENAHNAMADCQACFEVYKGVLRQESKGSTSKPSARQSMGLEDEFTFGKHKGQQLEDVITDHPDYIQWLISEGVVLFDEEAMELITKKAIA